MTPPRKKLNRYHRDIYFPNWHEKALTKFIENIVANGSITFSIHALEKYTEYCYNYGRNLFKHLVKSVKKSSLDISNIFEFYAKEDYVQKACFRYTFGEFPVDLILVISADGVVITMYDTKKGDSHTTMDRKLYEKG